MKRRSFMKTALPAGIAGIGAGSCAKKPAISERKKIFSFVHYSDVHIQPERGAREGFLAAIEKINSLKPDFAVSGGDLVMDVLAADESRANVLYEMYIECCKSFDIPVYNVMGNHEVFGITVPDIVPENHPEWGKEMFKKRLGDGRTYRSFDHKGVHFLLLDSVGIEKNENERGHHYIGEIGEEQMTWLKQDLAGIPVDTPVIAVAHIPYFTWISQIQNGPTFQNARGTVLTDGKELHDLLTQYRFFGFLEGHIHINELYVYKDVKYIDTAAVSGGWWSGPRDGHPEGFNLVHVFEDGIENEYMTYGWDASKYAEAGEILKLDKKLFLV
ncbi:MAG: metallophosphoesterase [Candidatus Latescibacteria bacterium]|jgi:3',5'-cyclic-AMP phosphodiesterase|nr:metallophosphoesterase [Candidatus Latescibacterota bacterium]